MSVPVIAFFNNKGGVGKTSLVYHVSWMLSELGHRVVAADLDPQANLTSAFLPDERLEELWSDSTDHGPPQTMFAAVRSLMRGTGDIQPPQLQAVSERLALIAGDMSLSTFEDDLSQTWPKCLDRDERAFRVTSAFWRVIQGAVQSHKADLALLDLGPNLGAINRSALVSADHVVVPLAPDLFSLQGLKNLGPTMTDWRDGWTERLTKNPEPSLPLPRGLMQPLGYIVMQHATIDSRPVRAYDKWIQRIPPVYEQFVLGKPAQEVELSVFMKNLFELNTDPNCIAQLRHFRSLMPMAQEARKPLFHLKSADGAIGSHAVSVQDARQTFETLARSILDRLNVPVGN